MSSEEEDSDSGSDSGSGDDESGSGSGSEGPPPVDENALQSDYRLSKTKPPAFLAARLQKTGGYGYTHRSTLVARPVKALGASPYQEAAAVAVADPAADLFQPFAGDVVLPPTPVIDALRAQGKPHSLPTGAWQYGAQKLASVATVEQLEEAGGLSQAGQEHLRRSYEAAAGADGPFPEPPRVRIDSLPQGDQVAYSSLEAASAAAEAGARLALPRSVQRVTAGVQTVESPSVHNRMGVQRGVGVEDEAPVMGGGGSGGGGGGGGGAPGGGGRCSGDGLRFSGPRGKDAAISLAQQALRRGHADEAMEMLQLAQSELRSRPPTRATRQSRARKPPSAALGGSLERELPTAAAMRRSSQAYQQQQDFAGHLSSDPMENTDNVRASLPAAPTTRRGGGGELFRKSADSGKWETWSEYVGQAPPSRTIDPTTRQDTVGARRSAPAFSFGTESRFGGPEGQYEQQQHPAPHPKAGGQTREHAQSPARRLNRAAPPGPAPPSASVMRQAALEAFGRGDMQTAEGMAAAAIDSGDVGSAAFYLLGECRRLGHMPDLALSDFAAALSLANKREPTAHVWYSRGLCLMELAEWGRAAQDFEKALVNGDEKDPAAVDAHINIAVCARRAGDQSVALLHFTSALELQPMHAFARLWRSEVLTSEDPCCALLK